MWHYDGMLVIRLSWLLLALGAAACVATPLLTLWAGSGAGPHVGGSLLYLPFYLAGAFAFWRRPDHRAARRLLLAGALVVLYASLGDLLSVAYLVQGPFPSFWVINTLDQVLGTGFFAALVGLLAVFPDGHYQRRYEHWLVWVWVCLIPVAPLGALFAQQRLFVNAYTVWADPHLPSPLYTPVLGWLAPLLGPLGDQSLLAMLVAAAILAVRYRRFPREQRLQITWPLLALVLFTLVPLAGLLAQFGVVPLALNNALFTLAIVFLPASFAIGIVKHRLLDIELVIRKSLIYGVLWLTIALAYAGLTALLGIAAGQRLPVGVAVVLTLMASLAFQPARQWLERVADRWVFGERLGGYALVRRVGAALQDTADLEHLAPRLAATVHEGLGVRWARVAVQSPAPDGPCFAVIGAAGIARDALAEPTAVAALVHGHEAVGRIECGPKTEGRWEARDQDLLETLGRQAALAIRNSRLAAELSLRLEELAASRRRIIMAEDAERRRIERNIHDGVQQDLVALMAKLALFRTQLGGDPAVLDAALARLQEETRQAVEDLRELARGIHPPVLTDRGLLEAIEGRAARLPLGITIEVDRGLLGRRFAAEIEGAAYFLVCEALTNIVKHAAAHHASIRLAAHAGHLAIQICDDGQGFDPRTAARAGLAGLTDRLEALGGTVQISSSRGQGTTVSATLPAREVNHG